MSFVIVTNRCFLTCEKVISVILQEADVGYRKIVKKTSKKKKEPASLLQFKLTINYVPEGDTNSGTKGYGNSNSEQHQSIALEICGQKEAEKLYEEVVREIREQTPDAAYLDDLVDKVLRKDGNDDLVVSAKMSVKQ